MAPVASTEDEAPGRSVRAGWLFGFQAGKWAGRAVCLTSGPVSASESLPRLKIPPTAVYSHPDASPAHLPTRVNLSAYPLAGPHAPTTRLPLHLPATWPLVGNLS